MKKLLTIILCLMCLNNVPTFHFSGTNYTKNQIEYINTNKETMLDNILNFFDKKEKIYHNADLV